MKAELELDDEETPELRLEAVGASAVDLGAAEQAVRDLLEALGYELGAERLARTPRRVAKALAALVTPTRFALTTFPNEDGYNGLLLLKDIPFHSLCEHHLLPFVGVAHVGYLPDRHIAGLSKLARVVDGFARGLQMQERITAQIAQCLDQALQPKGVGVVLEAEHFCMRIRGVEKTGSRTVTSTLLGTIRDDPGVRGEFLSACGMERRPA